MAEKLFDLILKKENLQFHLYNMNKYFLLGDGAFFQIFAEEMRPFMLLPPKSNSAYEINNLALNNVHSTSH